VNIKHPTLRKLRNRGLVAIRYRTPPPRAEARHGWIIEERPRGGLVIQLAGEERVRRLSAAEAQFVTRLGG
jgi:hypothetical protein